MKYFLGVLLFCLVVLPIPAQGQVWKATSTEIYQIPEDEFYQTTPGSVRTDWEIYKIKEYSNVEQVDLPNNGYIRTNEEIYKEGFINH